MAVLVLVMGGADCTIIWGAGAGADWGNETFTATSSCFEGFFFFLSFLPLLLDKKVDNLTGSLISTSLPGPHDLITAALAEAFPKAKKNKGISQKSFFIQLIY
jgi:hypothetical protein